MTRRRTALLALLLLGLLVWILGAADGWFDADLTADPEAGDRTPGPLLTAAGASTPEPAPEGPGLETTASRPAGPTRGPLRIRIVGADGAPLPQAFVDLDLPGEEPYANGQDVDGAGVATFPDVPYDGTAYVTFYRKNPDVAPGNRIYKKLEPRIGEENKLAVHGPELVYHARVGLWLDVELFDAETGLPLHAARVKARVPTREREDGTRVVVRHEPWRASPAKLRVMPRIGRDPYAFFELELPDGYARPMFRPSLQAISPYAKRLLMRQPLRPTIALRVTGATPSGRTMLPRVGYVGIGGHAVSGWSASGDAYERLTITGIPFLRDEILQLEASRPDAPEEDCGEWIEVRIPKQRERGIDVRVELPEELIETCEEIEESIGGSFSSRYRSRAPIRRGVLPDTTIRIRVLRRNGQPAVNAPVRIGKRKYGTTGSDGWLRVTGLEHGTHTITVHQVGLLPITSTFEITRDGVGQQILREDVGGTVRLTVVDQDGIGLPAARVRLRTPSKLPWIDMPQTTQRVDPYTDHHGRRELTHVEPGTVKLEVWWGSRRVKRDLEVVSGKAQDVRIVLPAPTLDR